MVEQVQEPTAPRMRFAATKTCSCEFVLARLRRVNIRGEKGTATPTLEMGVTGPEKSVTVCRQGNEFSLAGDRLVGGVCRRLSFLRRVPRDESGDAR